MRQTETPNVKTILTTSCEEAARHVRAGHLAAFPTETVYGLGADAFNPNAVRRIYRVKGRPLDNPMIVHLPDASEIKSVATTIRPYVDDLIEAFVPGPLTVVLEKKGTIPAEVTAGLSTVGIRVPSHRVAERFLRACGTPVVAPSANRSGRPSPTSWEAVRDDLDGLIPCILKGDRSIVGLESTVVDCTGPVPVILREGAVTLQDLRIVVPAMQPSSAAAGFRSRSPGLRHRHYAPEARVILYDAGVVRVAEPSAYIGLASPIQPGRFDLIQICRDAGHYAHELFHFFRECDRAGIHTIYCERPPASGIGVALLDRIRRAGRSNSQQ